MAAVVLRQEQRGDAVDVGGRSGQTHEAGIEAREVLAEVFGGVDCGVDRHEQHLDRVGRRAEPLHEGREVGQRDGAHVLAARVPEEEQDDLAAVLRQRDGAPEAARGGELAADAVVDRQTRIGVRVSRCGNQQHREQAGNQQQPGSNHGTPFSCR